MCGLIAVANALRIEAICPTRPTPSVPVAIIRKPNAGLVTTTDPRLIMGP